MSVYEAPAKLNLSLLVSPPGKDGYHPLESLVQTVEWCDRLIVTPSEDGGDTIVSDIEDNLVERGVAEMRKEGEVPPLVIELEKTLPVAAGLGGGSSDAAATLLAASDLTRRGRDGLADVARRVGADVALFLTGGTLMMRGVGDEIEPMAPLAGFAVGVVVPEFGLGTKQVYERWDRLEGPTGPVVPDQRLPPRLRGRMPMRNDLLPAALDVEPRLGDFMADVASVWDSAVCLTGSGSACFGYFPTVEEASDAVLAVAHLCRDARGVMLRDHGVARVADPER